jgi:hypothetical protein
MHRLKIMLIITVASVSVIAVFAITNAFFRLNQITEEIRLSEGNISLFEYCSHIGELAQDDTKCKDFSSFFGSK